MAGTYRFPSAALPLAIFILLYSLVNALASSLVLCMQWRHSTKLSCQWKLSWDFSPASWRSLTISFSDLFISNCDYAQHYPIDDPASQLYHRMGKHQGCCI
jgi:hypothetical protein